MAPSPGGRGDQIDVLLPQLAAGGGDVVAFGSSRVRDDTVAAHTVDEHEDLLQRRPFVDLAAQAGADGVKGDHVHVRAEAFEHPPEQIGLRRAVVSAGQQAVLDRGDAAGAVIKPPGGLHDLGHRVSAVHRHELGAGFVIGRVQRERQVHVQIRVGQPIDARYDADGRHGDLSPTQAA